MTRIDEAAFVRAQYETEDRLRARKSIYDRAEGDDPREVVFAAVAEVNPRRVLEVGGGEGELAERILQELDAELVAIDQSARMVEVQRRKGVDARVADVQDLPFADDAFDVAIAAWMLYHASDLDVALAELARVIRRGGRLVASTNALDHLQELWDLARRASSLGRFTFHSENGEHSLLRHFARVERRDTRGWVTMDEAAIRRYAASWGELGSLVKLERRSEPLRARTHSAVFVAENP